MLPSGHAAALPFERVYADRCYRDDAVRTRVQKAGLYPCDKRRPRRELIKKFPAVDFSLLPADKDPLWKQSGREPKPNQIARVKESLTDLVQLYGLTDDVVAIVGQCENEYRYGHSFRP